MIEVVARACKRIAISVNKGALGDVLGTAASENVQGEVQKKLDIIAKIVQILKDAPEVGAIEIRRGLFGAWSSVRVSKAGHASNTTGHVVVTQAPASASAPPMKG